jgi:hypothetical protein
LAGVYKWEWGDWEGYWDDGDADEHSRSTADEPEAATGRRERVEVDEIKEKKVVCSANQVKAQTMNDEDFGSYVLQLRGGAASADTCGRGPRSVAARLKRQLRNQKYMRQGGASPEEDPLESLWTKSRFIIWHVNIQGLVSHLAELLARVRVAKARPNIICVSETFLDCATEEVDLEGYRLVARRDRDDGRKCGGVAIYAMEAHADSMTLLLSSETHERVWILVHSSLGPFLVGAWYRPPDPGEIDSIKTSEWQELSKDAVGTIITGDM